MSQGNCNNLFIRAMKNRTIIEEEAVTSRNEVSILRNFEGARYLACMQREGCAGRKASKLIILKYSYGSGPSNRNLSKLRSSPSS